MSDFRPAWWLPGGHLQTLWPALARRRLDAGVSFVAVGADVTLLARGARDLAAAFA